MREGITGQTTAASIDVVDLEAGGELNGVSARVRIGLVIAATMESGPLHCDEVTV